MRRKRQSLSEAETIDMLDSCTSGVLALHGDDGYPYAVPLSFAYEDGKLFFHSAKGGHKIDAIERDEKASFCVTAADEVVPDALTTRFRSTIVFGKARVLADDGEKRHALECLARKYSPGRSADSEIERDLDRMCVVELAVEHMTGKAAIEIVEERA